MLTFSSGVLVLVATHLILWGVLMARRGRKPRLELEAEYWRLLQAGVGTVEAWRAAVQPALRVFPRDHRLLTQNSFAIKSPELAFQCGHRLSVEADEDARSL
jgi:hypothetical protein